MPYGDPNYHQEGDTADKVDYENAKITVQLTLAAVLHLDNYGRPWLYQAGHSSVFIPRTGFGSV